MVTANPSPTDEPVISIPRTWVVMVGAIAGGLIGAAIVFVWKPGWSTEQKELARSGPFVLWASLIEMQTMLWSLAAVPLVVTFRRHLDSHKPGSVWREVVPAAFCLAVLIVGLVVVPRHTVHKIPEFIPHLDLRVWLLTGLAGIVGLVAAMSIWLIRGRAEALAAGGTLSKVGLRTYLGLRSDLEWLLGYLGAVIGLAVLASAALGSVVKDSDPEYDPNVVILYGLVLTLFVALVYLPTWATMQRTGSLLRDRVEPLPEPASETFETSLKKRAALDELLGLRASASVSFKAGVAILTPLLASLTTLLPKLGG